VWYSRGLEYTSIYRQTAGYEIDVSREEGLPHKNIDVERQYNGQYRSAVPPKEVVTSFGICLLP